ncbi:kelch-like protein 9 [Branchiostoma floridae x Branchiostoma belcheri]
MASSADDSVRKVVRHEAHSAEMLGGFHKMRQSKTLCDVTLWAEEKPFAVHKTVLASTSEYFSVMFTCGMREIDQDDIYLHGITLAGLSTVLDFVYTSELPVSMETIQDVVCAASHLQISSALALCETFLRDEISLDNCLYVMNLCNTFGLKQLAKEATDFVAKKFQDLVQKKSDQILDLTWEEFLPILQNNKLNASELQVRVIFRNQ